MNQLIAQLRDLFESMTPGARITSGLLLLVAVVSLAFLFKTTASGPDAFLFGGERFSQAELNKMMGALSSANVSGWEIDSDRISVPLSKQQDAIAAIANAGALPANFSSYMDNAIDKASPMESRRQFELRTKTARENQLSLIITHMPWVESANVMLDIAERHGLNRTSNSTASVVVTPKQGEVMDQYRARNVKKLVAGSLSSLTTDNVQFINGGDDSFNGNEPWFDDPYLREREELQKSYKSRIITGLSYIPGVRVEVSADLNNKSSQRKIETTPNESKAIRSVTESESENSRVNDLGGRPGLVPNGPGRNGLDEGLNRENTTQIARDNTNEEFKVGETTIEEISEGFKPDELYASIAIPRDYVVDIWQQNNPDGDPTEITDTEMRTLETNTKIDVERFVQNILPRLSLGEDEYRQVEVIFYDAVKRKAPPGPTMAESAMAWAGRYWGSVSMLGLAAVSLLMLRSALKPAKDADPTGSLEIDFGAPQYAEGTARESEENERPKLKIKKTDSLKEDLSDMVREDPDAAANILRAWINNAS
ncbi:flagellar M-ring protein FliF C-terminal domain-containing protein [Aeoliella mucimassa]|uniref:Flagellar MS-ring protein n=1 Tax=Aeoliella mucimassa TaxID=2527972 RepID=A0A518AKU0_9BACT|nr:flagellar M-ring protein FliF C-terminal domain-containing protein [Aeoliella mucimassa]QDU55321.1 flagellar MS-ring protein [Aeoliella mucimassa]